MPKFDLLCATILKIYEGGGDGGVGGIRMTLNSLVVRGLMIMLMYL